MFNTSNADPDLYGQDSDPVRYMYDHDSQHCLQFVPVYQSKKYEKTTQA
jgi:hypothetical protein